MTELYKIGVTVALVNQASFGLAALARDFSRTDAEAKKLEATFKSIKMLTLAGGILTGAGILGIKGLESTYDAAKKYEQAFSRFKSLNLGDGVNADANKFAQSTRVMGTSATDLITTLTDLHTVMGDFGNAKAMAPLIARMEFANKAVFDVGSKFDTSQALSLAKVIELRGGFRSPEEMNKEADFAQHVMSGTGGRVMPSDYLAFMKTGGVAARLQNNDTFFYQMEPLIQELGGNRVGTGLMSAYQNLAQGRTTTRTAKELMRLGLVDPKMVEYSTTGQLKQIKPGGVAGGDMVGSDPMAFLKTILLPAFKSHGIVTDQAIINEIGTVFTNRTAAAIYTTLFQQMDKVVKNSGIDRNAMGIAELDKVADSTPEGQTIKAEKAWENLKIQLGLRIVPIVVPMIGRLADGLESLALFAERNPGLTTTVMGTATALTALAAVGGSLLLARAGLMAGVQFLGIVAKFGGASIGASFASGAGTGATAAAPLGFGGAFPPLALGAAGAYGMYRMTQDPSLAITYGGNGASGLTPAGEDTKASAGGGWGKLGQWMGFKDPAPGEGSHDLSDYLSTLPDKVGEAVKSALAGMSVDLDGRQVGSVVAGSIAHALDKPSPGTGAFDSRLGYPVPVGASP